MKSLLALVVMGLTSLVRPGKPVTSQVTTRPDSCGQHQTQPDTACGLTCGYRTSCSYDRGMADSAGGHVAVTRRLWDGHMSAWFERSARSRWSSAEPYWGMWCIPQSRLPVLPAGLAGAVAVELGCGSGYVSAWLARRGARPVGVDVSARQLAVAQRLQGEFELRFPLVQADAERVPLGPAALTW